MKVFLKNDVWKEFFSLRLSINIRKFVLLCNFMRLQMRSRPEPRDSEQRPVWPDSVSFGKNGQKFLETLLNLGVPRRYKKITSFKIQFDTKTCKSFKKVVNDGKPAEKWRTLCWRRRRWGQIQHEMELKKVMRALKLRSSCLGKRVQATTSNVKFVNGSACFCFYVWNSWSRRAMEAFLF